MAHGATSPAQQRPPVAAVRLTALVLVILLSGNPAAWAGVSSGTLGVALVITPTCEAPLVSRPDLAPSAPATERSPSADSACSVQASYVGPSPTPQALSLERISSSAASSRTTEPPLSGDGGDATAGLSALTITY